MSLSAIVITRNEEAMLPGCLKSLAFADEIIVVDAESHDKTINIAQKYHAKIITVPADSDYSYSRNQGMKVAIGDWLLYIDADERVSQALREEIKQVVKDRVFLQDPVLSTSQALSYKIPRQNIMLGRWLKHGGFWPDTVHRLFSKNALIKWTGKLHESPTVRGEVKNIHHPLKHYTARTVRGALRKSSKWSQLEAGLLLKANSPKVNGLKVLKAFNTKLFDVYIKRLGFLDGARGLILAFIQAQHQASVLVNLWQMQNKDSSSDRNP
ncbi:MAG: glycosyltransferase family 2 protein [Candidatus Chisholmbacteria bacterium]|nr:glycosyltransferase family 2 protein [Candidatus Chisholmbacteria bacterium]